MSAGKPATARRREVIPAFPYFPALTILKLIHFLFNYVNILIRL